MSDRAKPPARKDDFVTRYIGEQAIIVPVKEGVGDLGSIYTLNELGTRVWQLIDGLTPMQQIVEIIASEYEVSTEKAEKDVAEFLSCLEAFGLIRPSQTSLG